MFVDTAIAARLEKAEAELTRQYVEAYARLYPDVGAASQEAAGGRVSFAGKDSPLSRVDGAGLDGPVTGADMDAIEAFLRSRGAPSILETCPFADQSLFDLAGRRGYGIEEFLNLFALPLIPESGESYSMAAEGTGVEIHYLSKSRADADLWCSTVGRGFASMDAGDPPYMDIYRGIFGAEGTTGYLATVDGKPAGAGALKVAGRVAYLSTASTMPAFRRRGVQMILMMSRLGAATKAGCDLAAIVTDPGSASERNVLRAGFQMAYTRTRLLRPI